MKKLLIVIFFSAGIQIGIAQQKVTYSDTFDYSTSYCSGDSQFDNWGSFRSSLDTTNDRFMSITIKGTYDMVGKTCTDKYATRQIADALYNGTNTVIACDGLNWQIGNCYDYNCGSYSEAIELTLNQYTCNCGISYSIRPCVSSPNWGGINTEICQWYYQNANQRMIAEVLKIYGTDDIAISSLGELQDCINTQKLKFNVINLGTNSVSNYYIGYSINGTVQTPIYVNTALPSEEMALTLSPNYTFAANSSYSIKVWTYSPNGTSDSYIDNDTIYLNYNHTGSPSLPTAPNILICGKAIVKLSASGNASDSLLWYDVPTAGSIKGLGENFYTPFLTRTDTFYVEANRFKSTEKQFGTTFHNYTMISYDPNEFNGGMFNIEPISLIKVNGFKVQSLFNNPTPHYRVYVIEGGYNGYETDASAWTNIFDADLSTGATINTIPVDIVLEPGKKYGFYITTDPVSGEDIWVNYGNSSYTNADFKLTSDNFIYGLFGANGVYTPWSLDVECLYSTTCPSPSRKPVIVTISPKPSGAELITGSPFNGKYDLGFITSPDIVEVGNTITYEMSEPTNYYNTSYGINWEVTNVSVTNELGSAVSNSLYTFVNPDTGTGANAKFTLTPNSSVLDSNVFVKITYRDLGPFFCDTTITRIIHVASTPKPNFKFPSSICAGEGVLFENISTIHSGYMTYKWFFTANDSSDNKEPVYVFDNYGVYNVKLRATSKPYNIVKDTIIVVTVNEIPKVKFKVLNACEGNGVKFLNQTTVNVGTLNYIWNFGDYSALSTATNPTHPYAIAGGYKVTLEANSGGCIGQLTKNAYQFSKPIAKFTAPTAPVCSNVKAEFINNSSIALGEMGALWQFGDGNLSTDINITHLYASAAIYPVKLKMVSEFGCEDSMTKNVVIKPAPKVDFTPDKLCDLSPTIFKNNSTEFPGVNSAYTWTFDDATIQNTKNATKTWTGIGVKNINLKSVLTNGCSDNISKDVTVLLQAKANFEVRDICSGDFAVFSNKTQFSQGIPKYYWNFGDGSSLEFDYNPKHKYSNTSTNTFPVELVAEIVGGCNDTIKKFITVTEIPNCTFNTKSYFIASGLGYKFSPIISSNATYDWTFGEGGYSNQTSPIYMYLYDGNFKVKLVSTNAGGCKCESTQVLSVFPSSINSAKISGVDIYPNPANTSFNIKVNNQNITTIQLINSLGQIMFNSDFVESTKINTENLASGIYTLQIKNNGVNEIVKIIVTH
ncbi:MAG: T9SS type A sorting domain-containing protein [Bacteroidetes bacterium]|nr:T9SS type A sorting domain-containing protein [Bacteroidota bacterium]